MPLHLKFSADESVEKRIVVALREKHEVIFVDETMKGAEDALVLEKAEEMKTVLLTANKDFGELVYHWQLHHAGIILYRLHGLPIEEKISVIMTAIEKYGIELLNSFTVITVRNVRIRKQNT